MAEISTTPMIDVEDAAMGEGARWSIHRCNTCFALVLAEDAREHLWWHQQTGTERPEIHAAP